MAEKTRTWVEYKIIYLQDAFSSLREHDIPAKSDEEAQEAFDAWKELHRHPYLILKLIKKVTIVTELA